MSHSIRALVSSLGIRLLIPLVLTVGIVLTVYAFLSFASTRDHFLESFQAAARRSSDLIRRATHDGMLLNRLDDVQATIERLAEGPDLAAIRVYDKEGAVALSSNHAELGLRVPLTSSPCAACHEPGGGVPGVLEISQLTRLDGPEKEGESVLRHLQVIKNEASCAAPGCHATPAEESVLGVLDVEISTAPLEASLEASRRQIVWTTVALVVVLGAVATVFVRRVVQRPIGQLYLGTQRIAGGDLTTRIEIPGRHELALLAGAFNQMAVDLARARDELTEWSQTLEEKVARKSEELREAERQVLHMDKMASLGQLAATVAHELNNPLAYK